MNDSFSDHSVEIWFIDVVLFGVTAAEEEEHFATFVAVLNVCLSFEPKSPEGCDTTAGADHYHW